MRAANFMMLALPNTGSTWLAPILATHARLSYYDKEFFSPTCNPLHREELAAAGFGSELVSTYRNIVKELDPVQQNLGALFDETWGNYTWNFDKEVFGAWKVDWFARHFKLFVLDRKPGAIFPPMRSQVLGWYEAIYCSLLEAGMIQPLGPLKLIARAMAAHRIARDTLLSYDLPTINGDVLMTGDHKRVCQELEDLPLPLNVEAAATEIIATRQPRTKTWRDID